MPPQYARGEMMQFAGEENQVILATTNNVVNSAGQLIMGRGAALSVALTWPRARTVLGEFIKHRGPDYLFYWPKFESVVSGQKPVDAPYGAFQTKRDYTAPSDLELIRRATRVLKEHALMRPDITFHLPFPGIGLGGLDKQTVQTVLDEIDLTKNVIIWTK